MGPAANLRLVELLTGRRWSVIGRSAGGGRPGPRSVRPPRDQSGCAQDWYKRKIEEQESYMAEFHDAACTRAVLGQAGVGPTSSWITTWRFCWTSPVRYRGRQRWPR